MKRMACALMAVAAVTVGASAALPVGEWMIHPNFSHEVMKVVETSGHVYFVADNNLFDYDRRNDITTAHSRLTGLSDVDICSIYADPEGSDLLIVYSSGNMDLLEPSGAVHNLGDVAASTQLTDHTINDVAFSGGRIYVAGGWGIAVIDSKKHIVVESGIFHRAATGIAVGDDRLFVVVDGQLRCAPLSGHHATLDRFTSLGDMAATDIEWLGTERILWTDGAENCDIATLDYAAGGFSSVSTGLRSVSYLVAVGPDAVMAQNHNRSVIFDAEGRCISSIDTPGPLYVNDYRSWLRTHTTATALNERWCLTAKGLSHFKVATDGTVIIDRRPARPEGTHVRGGVWYLTPSPTSGAVYIANGGYRQTPRQLASTMRMSVNVISPEGFVTDLTPVYADVTIANPNSQRMLCAGYQVKEVPGRPDAIVVGTMFEGLYMFSHGKQVMKWDWTNMPIARRFQVAIHDFDFDSQGNLWVYAKSLDKDGSQCVMACLPAAKLGDASVVASDWVVINPTQFGTTDTYVAQVLACKHSSSEGIVVMTDGWSDRRLLIYDSKSTLTTADDTYYVASSVVDQDYKVIDKVRVSVMVEDDEGSLWLGTNRGVMRIANLRHALTTQSLRVERIKVPRNDGTIYADYLLDDQDITAIVIDAAGRKWISTATSGLYLVSADGREIISHLTTANSPLPSNEVLSLALSPLDNTLYVGTRLGLLSYGTDASPAASDTDLSAVYAYPNPVTPDFGGVVTIAGLPHDALVKVADAAGNVVHQTRSEGGMATWDTLTRSGSRAASGVYYIFVSTPTETPRGAVAKLLIVN